MSRLLVVCGKREPSRESIDARSSFYAPSVNALEGPMPLQMTCCALRPRLMSQSAVESEIRLLQNHFSTQTHVCKKPARTLPCSTPT